jgi:hypothetical protein
MSRYAKKQFTIFIIFLFIVVIIGFGVYFLVRPPAPTCFDGIQNQGEKGIDCGGPCGPCPEDIREPLEIISQDSILTTDNYYDLVAKIKNPNHDWGVELLSYNFGRQGETYLLPQETKYIIEQRVSNEGIENIKLELQETNWRKLKDFEQLDIRIRDKELKIIEPLGYKLVGNVENKSSYDLDKIEVSGLLLSNGKVIAAGTTEMRTIVIGETRYFEISWPYQISEEITSFELYPHTNVFLNDNFLKKHGTQERFKEY